MGYFTPFAKRDFSAAERKQGAKEGWAMPGGHFPIKSAHDVRNAVILAHSSNLPFSEVKAHIMRRAKDLGAEGELPADWKDEKEK